MTHTNMEGPRYFEQQIPADVQLTIATVLSLSDRSLSWEQFNENLKASGLITVNETDTLKRIFFNAENEYFYSTWDNRKQPRRQEEQFPAQDRAQFLYRAQRKHFELVGKSELAERTYYYEQGDIAGVAVPAIQGKNAGDFMNEWISSGMPIDDRPITPTQFNQFAKAMLQGETHADLNESNIIIGDDGILYAIDFTIETSDIAAPIKAREEMIQLLVTTATYLQIPLHSVLPELVEAARIQEQTYAESMVEARYNSVFMTYKAALEDEQWEMLALFDISIIYKNAHETAVFQMGDQYILIDESVGIEFKIITAREFDRYRSQAGFEAIAIR